VYRVLEAGGMAGHYCNSRRESFSLPGHARPTHYSLFGKKLFGERRVVVNTEE